MYIRFLLVREKFYNVYVCVLQGYLVKHVAMILSQKQSKNKNVISWEFTALQDLFLKSSYCLYEGHTSIITSRWVVFNEYLNV